MPVGLPNPSEANMRPARARLLVVLPLTGWLAACQDTPLPTAADDAALAPPSATIISTSLAPVMTAVELDTLQFSLSRSATRNLRISDTRVARLVSTKPVRIAPRAVGTTQLLGDGSPRVNTTILVRPAESSPFVAVTHPTGTASLLLGDSVFVRFAYQSARFGAIACAVGTVEAAPAAKVARLVPANGGRWVVPADSGTVRVTGSCPAESDTAAVTLTVTRPTVTPPPDTTTTDTVVTPPPPPPPTSTLAVYRLSGWAASAAGGAVLELTGAGFGSTLQVAFGGTPATVQRLTDSTARVTVPARPVGSVSVVATQGTATATLFRSFEVLPAPTVTHFALGMESGTLADVGAGTGPTGWAEYSTERAATGSRSLKFTAISGVDGNIVRMERRFASRNPAADNPNGLYQKFSMYIPKATYTNTGRGQIKLLLNRYDGQQTSTAPGWAMWGIGGQFPMDEIRSDPLASQYSVAAADYAITRLPGCTPFLLPADRWFTVQVWYHHANGIGTMRWWVDGEPVAACSSSLLGTGDLARTLEMWLGITYTQGASAFPLVLYVDDVQAANGFIDR
jgi:hypothetical protein